MSLNPGQSGESRNWNYSKPDKDGFSLELMGTVVALQEVQAMNFGADGMPTTPAFWENNNQPKMNIRIVLCGPKGGYRTLTFQPASKAAREGKIKSIHLDLFAIGGGRDMIDLIGKTIRISTVAPPAGFGYGRGNPRPWTVELVTDQGPFQLAEPLDPIYLLNRVLADTAVSGGSVNPGHIAPTPEAQAPAQQPVAPSDPAPLPPGEQPAPAPTPPSDDLPF